MARRSDHSRDELTRMALASARKIIAKEGLRGLTTRRIAGAIGYSAGTLYQLFADLDDLIAHVNAATLGALLTHCEGVDYAAGPEVALQELARRYMEFVGANQKLWSAVFEHSLPGGRQSPEVFVERTGQLLGLAETAIAPLYLPDSEERKRHDARVLWAGLYGIAALAAANKMAGGETPLEMVKTLIATYLAGLGTRINS